MKRLAIIIMILISINNLTTAQNNSDLDLNRISSTMEKLTNKVSQSIVKIIVTAYAPGYEGGKQKLVKARGSGSGSIIDPNGYIITNAHVVNGATKVEVQLSGILNTKVKSNSILGMPGEIVEAKIIGINKLTDIALLKIEGKSYPYLEFGDSKKVSQGHLVFAFGSPRGLENTVTMGIISTKAREVSEESPLVYIQTDAAINPGNSGGPLINTEGKIIGINSMIVSAGGGSEGIGFAIPSNAAKFVYDHLKKYGKLKLGSIGVKAQNITPTLAEGLGLLQNWGVILGDVYPGGKGDIAGLKQGDIILSIDGDVIEHVREFNVNILIKNDGEKVELVVSRDNQRFKVIVQVITDEDRESYLAALLDKQQKFVPELGIMVLETTDEIKQILPQMRKERGFIVTALLGGSTSSAGGFSPGDIIYSINRTPLYSYELLDESISKLNDGDPVVIEVERGGRLFFLSFEFEK